MEKKTKNDSELLTVNEFIKDTSNDLSQSYLCDRTILPLFNISIEKVKWFYSDETKSDAKKSKKFNTNASKWIPFDDVDSYNLELEYRNMDENEFESNCIIQVLDGLYEVDLVKRECYSIYWEANPMNVMRSIWFYDSGEPFEENSSNKIETKHNEIFCGYNHDKSENCHNLLSDKLKRERNLIRFQFYHIYTIFTVLRVLNNHIVVIGLISTICVLHIDEGTVLWYSKNDIYFEKRNKSVIDKIHYTLMKLRKRIQYNRIHRGFSRETKYEQTNQSKEITHLVFVIHGIAQKLDRTKIYKCCDSLSKCCEKRKREFFPQFKDYKFMFLPVDWRTSLALDNGLIESITIKNVQTIRSKLNYSALDIMYYSSPIYKTEIMNSLSSELNRLYKIFCEKNKNFIKNNGLVSLVAHSLGAVVVYDVLTSNTRLFNNYGEDINQEKLMFNNLSQNNTNLLNEYLDCKKRIQDIEIQLMKANEENNITPLDFKIENLFCFGSPLAVFLALRGVRPVKNGTQELILPKNRCKHLFNIFHPSDPVAYRLEPLISTHYSSQSALEIQKSHDVSLRVSHLIYKELNNKRHSRKHSSNSTRNETTLSDKTSSGMSSPSLVSSISHHEHSGLENAIDFQLQEGGFELMAVFTSHNCYWNNKDVALFITTQLVSTN